MRSSTAPFLFVLFITAQAKRIRSSSLPGIESRWNHEHLEPLADLGLTSLIQRHPVHDSEAYSQALHVIKSMESAPSCNRLATFTLIDSCRSLEGQNDKLDDDSSIELDQVKSTFAARLAICELISAHADVPDHCLSLVPQVIEPLHHKIRCFFPGSQCESTDQSRDSQRHGYALVNQEQTGRCLGALESRPQWWTSYSNARQNAISICHAARVEIERGKS